MSDKKPQNQEPSLEERLAKLEQAEAAMKAREEALQAREDSLAAMKDSGAIRPIRPSEAVTVGEGYLFEVSGKSTNSKLETKQITCCDESEAVRWYVLTTSDPERQGKQLDVNKYPLNVKCLDPRKAADRVAAMKLASIRAKAARGGLLNEEEQGLLEADERKLLNY
jgi:hypothetical protein